MKNETFGKSLFIVIVLLFCLSFTSLFASNQIFRHIGINEGLSQVNILSVYQDEMGTMWFGSVEGLNRYNGRDIKIFRPTQSEEGLTANNIYTITGNKKGALYVRSGKEFVRYDLLTKEFECIYKEHINHIYFDNDTLWAVTNDEILFYTEEQKTMRFYKKLDEGLANTSFILSYQDQLYIGTYKELIGISKSNPAEMNVLLSNDEIGYLYPDKKKKYMGRYCR